MFSISSEEFVASKLPLTCQWFNRMKEEQSAANVLALLIEFNAAATSCFLGNGKTVVKPQVPSISLYKSDPVYDTPFKISRIVARQQSAIV